MANKTTVVNKTGGVTTNIVETTNEAVSTTVFEVSDTGGKLITTNCIPTSGNYDYVKTVSIESVETGIQIIESFTAIPKDSVFGDEVPEDETTTE